MINTNFKLNLQNSAVNFQERYDLDEHIARAYERNLILSYRPRRAARAN